MSIEQKIEGDGITSLEHGSFDPEHVWGGEEWEWRNWENAERNMSGEEYNKKQAEEAVGIKTREAFIMVNGREPKPRIKEDGTDDGGDDELLMFFVINKGARYFKRRYFQYRNNVDPDQIAKYYKNKEWEIEKDGAAGF